MRKFTFLLLMVFISSTIIYAQTQVKTTGIPADTKKVEKPAKNAKTQARTDTYTCDFEDIDDWSLEFTPWSVLDVDGLPTYGFNSVDFTHEYEAMAYICFNPATTTPPMTDDPEIQPYAGERFGACMASVPESGQGNDDWFISSMIAAGDGASFTFWAKSYTDDYGLERFNVGVSTTGTLPEDFEIISGATYVEAPIVWTEYTYDLSNFAGQEIYVAIQCVSYDAFVFMIDDLVIDPGSGGPTACDDFDDLMPGDYVAESLPANWSTWSGAPGSSEDALVTNNASHSPENSFFTNGSTDLLRMFSDEDLTEGAWVFSFWSFIPSGNTGYFNLQKSVVPGVEWGIQAYCWPDGEAHVDAGGEDAAQFMFPFDEWWYTEIVVDLDNDWCELWVEGEYIYGFEWHLGTFGSGTLITLGSANLWAWNEEGECMHYFDDVCFEPYQEQWDFCNDFENYADFSLEFDPWNVWDVDGLPTYGFNGIEFLHNYEAMAYIVFNPASTTPPMTDDPDIQPYAGEKFAACFASVPESGQGNDDWLITPLTPLGVDSWLNFYAKSYTADYGLERFNVGVSTSGILPEDFTIISASPYEEAPADGWTEFTYDLSDYDYMDIYVGIQCVSYDAFVFMLDDVCIFTTPTEVNEVEESHLVMYPNPANDIVMINGNTIVEQVAIYNNMGQLIYQDTPRAAKVKLNTTNFSSGMYFVSLKTQFGTETKKLMVQ